VEIQRWQTNQALRHGLYGEIIHNSESLRHLLRFMTVGMLGTLIDVLVFSVLRIRLGLPALMANTVSYSTGTVNNYILHRNWTFANVPRKAFGVQFIQFAAVSLSALALNNFLLMLLEPSFTTLFNASGVSEMAAKACAMSAGMCLSFLLQHTWTFRSKCEQIKRNEESCE
jgi:putative flippase GtrA